jgi:hypothetical protein
LDTATVADSELLSPEKLWCTLQLGGQKDSGCFLSPLFSSLWLSIPNSLKRNRRYNEKALFEGAVYLEGLPDLDSLDVVLQHIVGLDLPGLRYVEKNVLLKYVLVVVVLQ